MNHRNGQCTRCGASFRIPATFAAHQARCRECGGAVRIERIAAPPRARRAPAATTNDLGAPAPVPAPIVPEPPAPIARSVPRSAPVGESSTTPLASEPAVVRRPGARRGRRLAWALAAAIVAALSLWMFWQDRSTKVDAAPSASSPPVVPDAARGE